MGAEIYTILAEVDYDDNGHITGCTSILEITPTMPFNDDILCIASDNGVHNIATIQYNAQGKIMLWYYFMLPWKLFVGLSAPTVSSVGVTEEMIGPKTFYNISWEPEDDIKNIDHFEVKVNTSTGSILTLAHPNTTNIEVILTNQVASSVEVSRTDKCQTTSVSTKQSEQFDKSNVI